VPALAVVVVTTLIAAHFLLTPNHLRELASSAMAAMLFVANVFFAYGVDTGYFADDASSKPLLHLWSLGVEEQFYLLLAARSRSAVCCEAFHQRKVRDGARGHGSCGWPFPMAHPLSLSTMPGISHLPL